MSDNKRRGNVGWVIAATVLAGLLGWVAYQTHHGKAAGGGFPRGKLEIQRADGSRVPFAVEIATTSEQQELGLMFHKELAAGNGMLFVWPVDQTISMWMKNTLIPLDMLFVAHDGVIAQITANAVPMDLSILVSDAPVRGVIEIGGGEAARQNIRKGDRVLYPAFRP